MTMSMRSCPPNPNVFVTVLENTMLRVRTDHPLSSRYSKSGQPVLFTLSEDVIVDNMLVIPEVRPSMVELSELNRPFCLPKCGKEGPLNVEIHEVK